MDELMIWGGKPLRGTIHVSGSKNASLPAMTAALIVPGKTRLHNVPDVRDVKVMCELLEQLGASWRRDGGMLEIDATTIHSIEAPYDLVRTMRASVLLLGPLLARCKRARVSLPGGCAIGTRPIDIHLKALAAMGAEISLDHGMVDIRVDQLKGKEIYLDFPTHTGTENIMMAAMGACGETIIYNAAREPEVSDLANLLIAMGARVEGTGTETIRIQPPQSLHLEIDHRVIPDRIESGTYAIAAAMTKGSIEIHGAVAEHLKAVLAKLEQTGAEIDVASHGICIHGHETIRSVDIQTAVFPGYPTDLQAQFMAMMCIADGESVITETIFENRFMHVAELQRMGADIVVRGRNAVVRGVSDLVGTQVMATDLRASASLVLAGLAARNTTQILRIYHLDRGYENLVEKLVSVGANIERVKGKTT